jgi:sigma-B regulation protein RsbU (phosphoserine phosphatase)
MRRLYLLLAVLFVLAAASQITYSIDLVRSLLGDYPQKPFNVGSPWATIVWLDASGRAAGLEAGDRIVAIDARVPRGMADIVQPVRERRTGDVLPVMVEQNGARSEHLVKLRRAGVAYGPVIAVIVGLFTPWLCLLLGFWVTALRPRDSRAWMVLALLLGLGTLVRAGLLDPRGWPLAVGCAVVFFWRVAEHTWGIGMMLFGIYFPQRWSVDRRLPWVKWIFILPVAATGLWEGLREAVQVADYRLGAALFPGTLPNGLQLALVMTATSIFFAALGSKYHDPEMARDDRRRLKLLYWGCTVAMTPSFLMFLYRIILHQESYGWLAAGSLALMGLFPLTMAYVIVVERAMDVRMVVRQGVQYALARRGIRVIQALMIIGLVFMAATVLGESHVSRPRRFTLIAFGTVIALRIRDAGERLRRWVDRRFFREAYNSEQILSDLSEQVRSILDRDALLETVARKISESLHVERIAVMLRDGALFRPALATGYPASFEASIPDESPLVKSLAAGQPVESDHGALGAQLVLPLASRKELLGFISLGPKKSEEPYTASDTGLLKSVAAQTGLALENSRLSEEIASEVAQRELLHREIEIAREVQQRLFPQTLPDVPTLAYAGHCRPARGVGGDYYDFLALASGRLGLVIGDVSGKGIPAALLMASLQASVRGQSQSGSGNVAELTANVNRLVCDASPENRYATFFYAQFDPATRKLVYTNGGHNPPILLRGSEVLRLENGGPPVGLFRFSQYSQEEIELQPGDTLVLFTDGISEAENHAEEEWGEDALIEAVRGSGGLAPDRTITRIMEAADAFAAGAPQHDDMTLVVARVLGAPPG